MQYNKLTNQKRNTRVNVWAESPPRPSERKVDRKIDKPVRTNISGTRSSQITSRINDEVISVHSDTEYGLNKAKKLKKETNTEIDSNFEAFEFKQNVQISDTKDNSDDEIGPKPLAIINSAIANDVSYGKALLPGEGSAIAAFVQQNLRIPRRGEIGWNGDDIQQLEETGYVMSGSRHKRMNEVRIRKENQVYSAEEKRALALITMEEKHQKDNKVIADFRDMLFQQLGKNSK